MLLNGQGRPMNLDGYSQTLAASMGGNKTPVIDQMALDDSSIRNWIEEYHEQIVSGEITPEFAWAPERLRRLSITEAAALQTFPKDYPFKGSNAKKYCQIGNAVPCHLAEVVAKAVKDVYFC
jgi:DNA (cytosine-5)-methyltransferase 1